MMPFVYLSLALAAPLATESPRDWGESLRLDATALHHDIAVNHPGPVNPDDPGFAKQNDAQLKKALSRVSAARSFEHYFYALKEYVAAFDDGHMSYGVYGDTPDTIRAWPGFLTRYDNDGKQRVFISESWSGVPKGARLISCDKLTAEQVARDRVGSRFGRWNLNAQRQIFGAMTFLDRGDPYVGSVSSCHFSTQGRSITATLDWRPPDIDLYQRYIFPTPIRSNGVVWRRLPDGTLWLNMPSFDGDPNGETGKALRALISRLGKDAGDARRAKAIVLDLRGNGGGSSDWSSQIAERLWGERWLGQHPEPPMTVRWRASTTNLEYLKKTFADRSKGGNISAETADYFRETIAGLEQAIEQHRQMWTVKPEPLRREIRRQAPVPNPLPGPVYIVIDSSCMSACLDAVDLWTRLGAIPVGQESGADTLYMEVRRARLPSSIGGIAMPMKVYSGRPRGSNQPVVPRYRFNGDMADTTALERWVSTLPQR